MAHWANFKFAAGSLPGDLAAVMGSNTCTCSNSSGRCVRSLYGAILCIPACSALAAMLTYTLNPQRAGGLNDTLLHQLLYQQPVEHLQRLGNVRRRPAIYTPCIPCCGIAHHAMPRRRGSDVPTFTSYSCNAFVRDSAGQRRGWGARQDLPQPCAHACCITGEQTIRLAWCHIFYKRSRASRMIPTHPEKLFKRPCSSCQNP
jgi:hypothetical protein